MNSKFFTFLLLILVLSAYRPVQGQTQYLIKSGTVDSLFSDVLQENREIYIQLPDSFNPDSKRQYPVVYLMDGDGLFDALSTVHNYYWGGFMPEMVLVGIANRTHRNRDLTTSGNAIEANEEQGQVDKFTRFIEKDLIPYIENKYPVTQYRTLIGHSYGGLFTLNAFLHHTELFNNYLAIDPSLQWDEQGLLKQARTLMKSKKFEGKSLFISLASQLHMQDKTVTIDNVMEDESPFTVFARSNIEFYQLAKAQEDLKVDWKYYPLDLHGSIPLPSIMDGLVFIFDWYQMENTDLVNNPETSVEATKDWLNKRADKLESHFGYAFPPMDAEFLNGLGYMYKNMGQPEKSRMFFKSAVQYYPENANAHDSLADSYAATKDFENALKHVTRAFELSGSDYHKKRMEEFKGKK